MPILTDDQLFRWVGGFQVVLGWIQIVAGLRKGSRAGTLAPMGVLWFIAGLLIVLNDIVADAILIPAASIAGILAIAWFIRELRASRSRSYGETRRVDATGNW